MRTHTFMVELASGEILTKEVNAPDVRTANRAMTGWLNVKGLDAVRLGCIPAIEEYAAFLEKGAANRDYTNSYRAWSPDFNPAIEHELWKYTNAAFRTWALDCN